MKTRDIFIIGPLLAICVLCYFLGHRQGWRAEKRADTEFNIKRVLRVLQYAESGDTDVTPEKWTGLGVSLAAN